MKYAKTIVVLMVLAVCAMTAWANEFVPRDATGKDLPGRTAVALSAWQGQSGPWVAPRNEGSPLDLEPVVWVDDSWTSQGDVDLFNNTLIWNTNAFNTIQAGIDAVDASGTVNVLPGNYTEVATNRTVVNLGGTYQFGLYFGVGKDDITLQGVDAGGSPITSYLNVVASVGLNATNNFGPSGMWVEADGITVTGLDLWETGDAGYNKTIEVVGDDFTFMHNIISDGMSLYFGDFRFDTINDISWIQSYHIEGNKFDYGTSIDLTNGAGYTGAVSGRQIINNVFEMDWPNYVDDWAAISFNGSGSGVPWFVYSTGAAVITGNTFLYAEGFYIRHRGDFVNYGDFNWATYWSGNTFDKKVAFGTNPPSAMGTYSYPNSYGTFNNVKEIGANIQREIDWAAAGHTVLCGAGTYDESINYNKHVDLIGAGSGSNPASNTIISKTSATVITLAASGNSAVDPILIKDLRLRPTFTNGIAVNSGSVSYIKLDNVDVIGTNENNSTENEKGLMVNTTASLSNLEIINSAFDHLTYGWYFFKHGDWGPGGSMVSNVTVTGTSFSYNDAKGIYVEKLTNATFNGCTVTNNGLNLANFFNAAFHAGFDFNLKGQENYQNLLVQNSTFTSNALGAREGVALTFKARGSGTDGGGGGAYQLNPASLTNVQVTNCLITGNERGVRFGEPGQSNSLPAGYVYGSAVHGNVKTYVPMDGSAYGDVINQTTACCNAGANWWGNAAPNWATQKYGTVDYSPWMGLAGTNANPGYTANFSSMWIDDDSPTCGGTNFLQEAVNLVSGSTINLMPGNYVGQVKATGFANLNIIGAGAANTFIKATASTMPDTFGTAPSHNRPILWLEGCTSANLSNLTIDGDGLGNLNNRFVGVAFRNSGGSMTNVNVVEVRETPLSGSQHGVAVWVGHNTTGRTVNLTNVNITDFQKNGTVFNGVGTIVNCNNVHAVGAGAFGVTAQNGYQYSFGASGSMVNSSASDVCYTGPTSTATGILSYDAGVTTLTATDALNCQTGLYYTDAGGSVSGGSFTANPAVTLISKSAVRYWGSAAALSMPVGTPEAYVDEISAAYDDRSLDDNEAILLNGLTVTGDGSVGSYGVRAFNGGGDLTIGVTNCDISNWNYGVDLTAGAPGTISDADVTNNTFTNTVNTFDNTAGHNWDSNCYSDYSSNFGYPVNYEIPGAVPLNLDLNPNPNGCSDVNMLVSDELIGCGGSCDELYLYLTLAEAGIPNLQVFVQLPAGFGVNLPPMGVVTPPSNADVNLIQAFASYLGSGMIQVDMGFNGVGGYSTGDFTRYVARIPVINLTAPTGTYGAAIDSTNWIDMLGGNHPDALTVGTASWEVDCTPPVITSFTNLATCAFGDASQLVNQFSVSLNDAASTLDSAWITFAPGGGSFPLFGANQTAPYNATLPSGGDAATFYGYLVEGCNTLTLHLTDTECNTATTVDIANVGRDNTAPSLSVATSIPANYCFNNNSLTVNYGGAYLDNYLDITASLGANACMAATGTLIVSYGALADFTVALNQTGYPTNDAEALALWNWMLSDAGIAAANGASFIFNVKAVDCAGNMTGTQTFEICVDTQTPGNAVTVFDARPAHLGVWLKWSWDADADAQEMRIYRSPLSGQYPGYPGDLWNTLANYDVTAVPPSGWTLVATQTALTGTVTSASYAGLNNRGDALTTHVDGGATYWLDAQGGWVEGNGNAPAFRDIYRYVTFVKDAGGNWSVGAPVVMTTNADRSTNYWLGDFSTADAAGLVGSRGYVDTEDLGLLSPVYFTNTGGYRNIGPVVVENDNIGKGIPNPEGSGAINFQDLVPFSFNFGLVSPVGVVATEFVVQPDVTQYRPFGNLDQAPQVTMATSEDVTYDVGTEFTVALSLTGNEGRVVKAVEAVLSYDESRLEYVSSSVVTEAQTEGTLFSKSALINNEAGSVGFVAAACGGISTLDENVVLGTVTFRVTREMDSPCEIALTEIRMLDNTGEVRDTDGDVISVTSSSAVPDNYALYQNYPNPFNPTTNIRFDVKEAGRVTVLVYNTLGQLVATPVNADMSAGRHEVTFDATNLTSGLYIYSISVNGFSDLKKMVLIR